MKELIHQYLKHSNNVELLNIYSRKYNHVNWFEIYVNQESSEKQAENQHGTYHVQNQMKILNFRNILRFLMN